MMKVATLSWRQIELLAFIEILYDCSERWAGMTTRKVPRNMEICITCANRE